MASSSRLWSRMDAVYGNVGQAGSSFFIYWRYRIFIEHRAWFLELQISLNSYSSRTSETPKNTFYLYFTSPWSFSGFYRHNALAQLLLISWPSYHTSPINCHNKRRNQHLRTCTTRTFQNPLSMSDDSSDFSYFYCFYFNISSSA